MATSSYSSSSFSSNSCDNRKANCRKVSSLLDAFQISSSFSPRDRQANKQRDSAIKNEIAADSPASYLLFTYLLIADSSFAASSSSPSSPAF